MHHVAMRSSLVILRTALERTLPGPHHSTVQVTCMHHTAGRSSLEMLKLPTPAPAHARCCQYAEQAVSHGNAQQLGDVEVADGGLDARGRRRRAQALHAVAARQRRGQRTCAPRC